MVDNSVSSPLKWHGGKSYLAKKIVELMPPRCKTPNNPGPEDAGWLHYVEPFAGGLSVLLANDPEGISEVVNDVYTQLAHFWFCLSDERVFLDFIRMAQATPFSEDLWEKAREKTQHCIARMPTERAVEFFVCCRQSLAGRMDTFAPLSKSRTRRGMNEQASAWINAIDGLPKVHARLRRVVVLNEDALKVIKQQDGPRTLFYLDPPYLHETRKTTGEYEHEMTAEQHAELLSVLADLQGRFLLSGYRSDLYDNAAKEHGWRCVEFELPNNAASGKTKRRMVECVWMNY